MAAKQTFFNDSLFFVIGNIPGNFRSHNLRAFFSQFIEKGGFTCFHFKHRPEHYKHDTHQAVQAPLTHASNEPRESSIGLSRDISESKSSQALKSEIETVAEASSDGTSTAHSSQLKGPLEAASREAGTRASTCCCIVAVGKTMADQLKSYNGKNWYSGPGEKPLRQRVKIVSMATPWQRETSTDKPPISANIIYPSDISHLPELNPPSAMPQGNVGTSLATFLELIQSCKLPSQVIKNLKLEFPRKSAKRRYGAVPMEYGTSTTDAGTSTIDPGTSTIDPGTSTMDSGTGTMDAHVSYSDHSKPSKRRKNVVDSDDEKQQDDEDADDDFDAEEWERYEALHNDVDKQERTAERLFEEELEVVWEKGSSGLVFYTDASYWDHGEGDFDEKCSKEDDWDVDMGGYYGYENIDKFARDMIDMSRESRLRGGQDQGLLKDSMEALNYTKGIGSKLLKKSGWKEGGGLGKKETGISQPLEAEGQTSKAGLGYRGEKLSKTTMSQRRPTREVLISTIYDRPDEEQDTVHRKASTTTIKFRDKFISGGLLPQSACSIGTENGRTSKANID